MGHIDRPDELNVVIRFPNKEVTKGESLRIVSS